MSALLDALKDAVRDFAACEEKLTSDYGARTNAAAKLADDATAERTNKLADAVENENADYTAKKSRLESSLEARKARINRAHASARKRVMDEIAGEQGQFKDRVQSGTREAEAKRDEALAQTVVVLESFRAKVAEAADSVDQTLKHVRRVFGGYGKFKRLLSVKPEEPDLSLDENQLFEQFQRLQKKVNGNLDEFKKFLLPKIFRFLPVWLIGLLLV